MCICECRIYLWKWSSLEWWQACWKFNGQTIYRKDIQICFISTLNKSIESYSHHTGKECCIYFRTNELLIYSSQLYTRDTEGSWERLGQSGYVGMSPHIFVEVILYWDYCMVVLHGCVHIHESEWQEGALDHLLLQGRLWAPHAIQQLKVLSIVIRSRTAMNK